MGIFDSLGDLWSWLTTQQGGGGSAGGTPYLGAGSPTASTQTPTLGSQPPAQGGFLSGLLGGQQPANPMSYFQPQGGGLLGFGNTPLGGMIRGGLEGLQAGTGVGGLRALGAGVMGEAQAEQQRRQQQMEAVLAGQKYQGGQQQLVQDAIKNQQLVQQINIGREIRGLPDVTLNDILTHPELVSQAGLSPTATTTATATTAAPSPAQTTNPPIVPTAQTTNPNVTAAYPPGTAQFPPTSPVATQQLPPTSGLGSGGLTDPSRGSNWVGPTGIADPTLTALASTTPPPPAPSAVAPAGGTAATRSAVSAAGQQQKAQGPVGTIGGAPATMQPAAQPSTAAQPAAQPQQTTAAQPSQAGGGTFTMPRTIQELEASNLPDWAKQQLYPAYLSAGYSGDYTPIYNAWAKVNEQLRAPAQAAATEQAKILATEDLRPNQVKALGEVQSKYMGDPVVQAMQTARPIYRAGFSAYQNEQKKPSTQNELDLVNSALQMMDNKAQPLRIGSADSLRQAENLPDLLYKSFKKLTGGGQLQPEEANALMDIINSHYKSIEASYNVNLGNYRQQAEYATGSHPGQVPDSLWRPDAPPPPPTPEIIENPTTHEKMQGTYEWDGEKWVRTGWQPT